MKPSAAKNDPTVLTRAHALPFAVFLGMLMVLQLVAAAVAWDHPDAPWWRQDPAHWFYPLQCLVCGVLLVRYWRFYQFHWSWKWSLLGAVAGLIGIGFWLLPTITYDLLGLKEDPEGWLKRLGVAERRDGFDPGIFEHPLAWWSTVILRFVRAVVIVSLVEEIFWRGFMMRFVLDWEGDYWKQPFGKASWLSWAVVTGAFMLAHNPIDYAGALVYGSLTYAFCVWSKNLGGCVVMHAVANLTMGLFALLSGKSGLW